MILTTHNNRQGDRIQHAGTVDCLGHERRSAEDHVALLGCRPLGCNKHLLVIKAEPGYILGDISRVGKRFGVIQGSVERGAYGGGPPKSETHL